MTSVNWEAYGLCYSYGVVCIAMLTVARRQFCQKNEMQTGIARA